MPQRRLDQASIAGIVISLLALAGGQALEGGHLGSLLQGAAAIIVLGGTAGATLLSVPLVDLRRAVRLTGQVFAPDLPHSQQAIDRFVEMAAIARKDGLIALDALLDRLPDHFSRRAVERVVDGGEGESLREILETDVDVRQEADRAGARVFEAAGAYAPTIGILGAVFGLIHAMDSLSDPAQLGRGIAVAFVATIYGVGLANLILLPIASRLERQLQQRRLHEEMVIEGVLGLEAGRHPRDLQARLTAFLADTTAKRAGTSRR